MVDRAFHDLTEEQKEKARACKTPEEILALAESEGMELSDEELESVAGGKAPHWNPDTPETCPHDCFKV